MKHIDNEAPRSLRSTAVRQNLRGIKAELRRSQTRLRSDKLQGMFCLAAVLRADCREFYNF